MATIKFIFATTILALVGCSTLFGQSAVPVDRTRTCHIHGTIRIYTGSAVSNVTVTFKGEKFGKTVFSDDGGSYDVDLPAGLYTMSAYNSNRFMEEFRRPLFRVGSSTSLTLNVTLEPVGGSCDLVGPVGGPPPNADTARSACGGWDSFSVPSADGAAFEVLIQFGSWQPTDHGDAYSIREPLTGIEIPPLGQKIPDDWPAHGKRVVFGVEIPVFVAYNLFTLRAKRVVYDVQSRTLEATGNVVAINADGSPTRADSMKFRIENGQAIPLH